MQASALGNFLPLMGELFLICRVTKYICLDEDFIFLPRGFVNIGRGAKGVTLGPRRENFTRKHRHFFLFSLPPLSAKITGFHILFFCCYHPHFPVLEKRKEKEHFKRN